MFKMYLTGLNFALKLRNAISDTNLMVIDTRTSNTHSTQSSYLGKTNFGTKPVHCIATPVVLKL